MKHMIDMWYGGTFNPEKHRVDVYFSDTDGVYRGNIYDEAGKAIGDFWFTDSVWGEKFFNIKWKD